MPYLQVPTQQEIEDSLLKMVEMIERELPKDEKIEEVELEDTGLQLTITDHVAALKELYADTDWRDYPDFKLIFELERKPT
jgi:hypothetical protein